MGEELSLFVLRSWIEPIHQQDPAWSTGSPVQWMLHTGLFSQRPRIYVLV